MLGIFIFSVLEGTGKGNVYSPAYLDYITSSLYHKKQGEGANFSLALGSSTSGRCPVVESKMPFSRVYNENTNSSNTSYLTPIDKLPEGTLNQVVNARITDTTSFANIYKEIDANNNITYTDGNENKNKKHEYTSNEVEAIRTLVKEHIQTKGPISTTMYTDITMDQEQNFVSEYGYCNLETWAYFCNDPTKKSNHAVTIVGWDDNYAVSNFNEEIQPKNPGAYIILNSYGEEVGKNGYIYISYEDVFVEQMMEGINELEEYETEEDINYSNIYQYDELGSNFSIGLGKTNFMAANVFSRDRSQTEYLNEVGIFLPITEGVQIYVNANDSDMTHLTQVAVETDRITPGYHIIKLANPIQLTGDKFVVAAKYINSQDGSYVALEANWKDSGISFFSNYFDTAKSNEGESFLSQDEGKTWQDVYHLKLNATVTLKNTNVCLKAYTDETATAPEKINVTGIRLNKTEVTVKEGENIQLEATVIPANASNQNIKWSSDNEKVATVSDGKITGVSKGKATITATSEEGNYTANCEVTVSEKTEAVVKVTGIDLNKETVTVYEGETDILEATVIPANASNQNIKWSSDDEKVATVSDGKITGVSKGKATITATSEEGNYTANCEVTVKEKIITTGEVTGITLNKETLSLEVGDKSNLVATITPMDAINKNVTWKSSNTEVATITDTGIITAIKEGNTTITVTTLDGNFSATCRLTVVAKSNKADDIYKEPNTNKGSTLGKDDTVANTKIPFAGNFIFILISVIVLFLIIMIIVFFKYRNLKDVK